MGSEIASLPARQERPHRLWQAYGDRRETEAKKSEKPNAGIRNSNSNIYSFWEYLLPCLAGRLAIPEFGLPALGPNFH